MASCGEVILVGDTLGERHRYFNNVFEEMCRNDIDFNSLPENTPINRILKIDIANSKKNVDYLINTLQDDDMLYVSRVLRYFWLLEPEYRHIINPDYLEKNLYPKMIKTAVNKMKNWIQVNLKDQYRCEEFYSYYRANFKESIKYLRNCSPGFIVEELGNIVDKIEPEHLKTLCMANPKVGEMYFKCLLNNREALLRYIDKESEYFNSLRCILKSDGDSYLKLIETYFNEHNFDCLSPDATRYIMKNYKSNFEAKKELYASQILNLNALASCLSLAECKELVINLAKAEYLSYWFEYKSVEPFIKRLPSDERAGFKKLIFVDKLVGDKVKEWPYPKPSSPKVADFDDHIFHDSVHEPYEYECQVGYGFKPMLMKRKYHSYANAEIAYADCCDVFKPKTMLDRLFDHYRFTGFAQTYTELSSRLQTESTPEGRQRIFLVLISKSGGVPDQVERLMKLLVEHHRNEPSNVRAAVVRSFVKRVSLWRMPDTIWNQVLEFSYGLGLDGREGDPLCVEGLHAVILRHILNNMSPNTDLLTAYIKHFTTFEEYNLNGSEINKIKENLPKMLFKYPTEFLNVVSAYKIKIDNISGAVEMLAKAAVDNKDLVNYLFEKRIARKELITQTFPLKQFEASYINSLRHDLSLLENGEIFASLATKGKTNHDRFLQSLALYFGEKDGLAAQHLRCLENSFKQKPKLSLVRPIAALSSSDACLTKIKEMKVNKCKENSRLVALFRENIHKAKPALNIKDIEWCIVGPKGVANKLFICRSLNLEEHIRNCLKWRNASGLALRLALNTSLEEEVFSIVAAKRPKLTITVASSYFFNESSRNINPNVWNIIKEIILKYEYENLPRKALNNLENGNIPKNIEADFWVTVYKALVKIEPQKALSALCKIENMLDRVDGDFIEETITTFIKNDLVIENFINPNNLLKCGIKDQVTPKMRYEGICMYMRIAAKYLLLSKSEEEQTQRMENILHPLFNQIEELWKKIEEKSYLTNSIYDFLKSLKYTNVFIDKKYVSCMPVFEKVIERLQKIMPRIEYFDKYVKLHLTILYYKTLRFVLDGNEGCFDEENIMKMVDVVGLKFGELLGKEVEELVQKFFISIIDIYKESLKDFLTNFFQHQSCFYNFIATVTKGILKNDSLEAHLIAEYLFEEYQFNWSDSEEIFKILKNSRYQEINFLLHADLIENVYRY